MEVYLKMAGGYKIFGPTYNATKYVRLGHEGIINGNHNISGTLVDAEVTDLAGKIAAITADGVGLADGGVGAVGLFTEDLEDMVNASHKASFYFRGGEYYVAAERLGTDIAGFTVGEELTTDAEGALVPMVDGAKPVGVVVSVGEYHMGNMYEHAGAAANGGEFLGFILYV